MLVIFGDVILSVAILIELLEKFYTGSEMLQRLIWASCLFVSLSGGNFDDSYLAR